MRKPAFKTSFIYLLFVFFGLVSTYGIASAVFIPPNLPPPPANPTASPQASIPDTRISTAFSAGSVIFTGVSGVYSQDNTNLYWDDINNRLGIGIASPDANYKITTSGGGIKADSTSQPAGYFSSASGYGLIVNSGNVGIGTTAPGSTLDVKGTLRLSGSASGYVGLAPAATAGSVTYTLPSVDGSSGQVLSTNGAGVLSWVDKTPSVATVNTLVVAGGGGGNSGQSSGVGGGGGGGGGYQASAAFTVTAQAYSITVGGGGLEGIQGGNSIFSTITAIGRSAMRKSQAFR